MGGGRGEEVMVSATKGAKTEGRRDRSSTLSFPVGGTEQTFPCGTPDPGGRPLPLRVKTLLLISLTSPRAGIGEDWSPLISSGSEGDRLRPW